MTIRVRIRLLSRLSFRACCSELLRLTLAFTGESRRRLTAAAVPQQRVRFAASSVQTTNNSRPPRIVARLDKARFARIAKLFAW